MTITEAHIEFRQSLDKLNSSSYPDFETEQVDYFLNDAYLRFVKTRYSGNNILKESFESVQKRIDDLRMLVKTEFCQITTNSIEENEYLASLTNLYTTEARNISSTNKYMLYLRGNVKVNSTRCGSGYKSIDIIKQDEIDIVKTHPFRKSTYHEPVGYFIGDKISIMTDGTFTVDNFKLTYLKYPTPVSLGSNITFETAEHTHKEIVELAVYLALENVESPRQQTKVQTNSIIE